MTEGPKLSEEIKTMEYEPLLPAEKKMIVYNLVIGVILLVSLVWVSRTFFPVEQTQIAPATGGQEVSAPAH